MFICNFKLNLKLLTKIAIVIVCIIVLGLCAISAHKIFGNRIRVSDKIRTPEVIKIAPNNYTNVLKAVHDNLGNYIGQRINFSGYVYRTSDFDKNQFVLARDMVINSNSQTVIVGFLSEYKDTSKLKDGEWVEITGIVTKGNYHGEIPVIEIKELKSVDVPNDPLVYPPDDSYVQTSIISFNK